MKSTDKVIEISQSASAQSPQQSHKNNVFAVINDTSRTFWVTNRQQTATNWLKSCATGVASFASGNNDKPTAAMYLTLEQDTRIVEHALGVDKATGDNMQASMKLFWMEQGYTEAPSHSRVIKEARAQQGLRLSPSDIEEIKQAKAALEKAAGVLAKFL